MCVRFHCQRYLHGSRKVLNACGKLGGPKKLIGGQIKVFSCFPQGHHVTLANKGVQVKVEVQYISSQSPIRNPGAGRTKNVAQVAYGLRFGRSTYGWKAKKITFPMPPVPCLNSVVCDGNHRFSTEAFFCPELVRWAVYQVGPNRGRVLGFEDDPHHVLVVLYPLLYPHSRHKQIGFCFVDIV